MPLLTARSYQGHAILTHSFNYSAWRTDLQSARDHRKLTSRGVVSSRMWCTHSEFRAPPHPKPREEGK